MSTAQSLLSQMRSSFAQGQSPVSSSVSATTPVEPSAPAASTQDNLALLETILDEVEAQRPQPEAPVQPPLAQATAQPSVVDQALPTVIDQTVAEVVAPQLDITTGRTAKESIAASTPDQTGPDLQAGGAQYVEVEKTPEIPTEVEHYLEHVENHAQAEPQEIVIAADQTAPLATHYPQQPVIVLPITPELEQTGVKKNFWESIRWLVEWSRKLMKKFSGKIVYRQVEASN